MTDTPPGISSSSTDKPTNPTEDGPMQGSTTRRRHRRSIEDRLYTLLGNEWCGNTTPPMDNRSYRWGHEGDDYRVFAQGEDGGVMWIGSAHQWNDSVSLKRFRRIAMWTLWQWAWGDWFGIRTRAWYFLLHRRCAETRKALAR